MWWLLLLTLCGGMRMRRAVCECESCSQGNGKALSMSFTSKQAPKCVTIVCRERNEPGPFNAMFAWDAKKQKMERTSYRYCYTWNVYVQQLLKLQSMSALLNHLSLHPCDFWPNSVHALSQVRRSHRSCCYRRFRLNSC